MVSENQEPLLHLIENIGDDIMRATPLSELRNTTANPSSAVFLVSVVLLVVALSPHAWEARQALRNDSDVASKATKTPKNGSIAAAAANRIQIVDSVMYSGEAIIPIRISLLYNSVDRFYICESNTTFSGQPKPLYSKENAKLFEPYEDKITWLVFDDTDHQRDEAFVEKHAWARETRQRNYPLKRMRQDHANGLLRDDFVVIQTDGDEIPNPKILGEFHPGGKYYDAVTTKGSVLVMMMFYYSFHWKKKRDWTAGHTLPGSMLINGSYDMEQLRNKKGRGTPYIPKGGWHASYFGDVAFVKRKIESFSHMELNTPEYNNATHIQECFRSGKDLFKRGRKEVMYWYDYRKLPGPLQEFHRVICASQGVDPDLQA